MLSEGNEAPAEWRITTAQKTKIRRSNPEEEPPMNDKGKRLNFFNKISFSSSLSGPAGL